jgi:predicted glycoside hydrolase/deacetylase ChbG (UPF0249 family)
MKHIILCADDFGQTHSISEGILQLVTNQRLNAVSCMVGFEGFAIHARALAAASPGIAIGLHFNLTEGPERLGSLPELIQKSHLKRLPKHTVTTAFGWQMQLFQEQFGRLPDFIDGHQHIQHLPVIRDVIFDWYEQATPSTKPYLRVSYSSLQTLWQHPGMLTKGLIINLIGARRFKTEVLARNIPHNPHFSGIYNFKRAAEYKNIFPNMLQSAKEGTLIMCHPGLTSNDTSDALATYRVHEFTYLMSEKFLEDCAHYRVTLF